jgi:hypothetical protein
MNILDFLYKPCFGWISGCGTSKIGNRIYSTNRSASFDIGYDNPYSSQQSGNTYSSKQYIVITTIHKSSRRRVVVSATTLALTGSSHIQNCIDEVAFGQ